MKRPSSWEVGEVLFLLVLLVALMLAPGCRALRQVGSSVRVSYYKGDAGLTTGDVLGVSVTGDLEAEAFIQPLAWLEVPREVIVVERPRPGGGK